MADGIGRWLVCHLDGMKVAGPFGQRALAERHRDKLENRQACTERPCISCRTPFMSEGPHHRMCPVCRAHRHVLQVQFEGF